MNWHKNTNLALGCMILAAAITGCTNPHLRRSTAEIIAAKANLHMSVISTSIFEVVVFHRGLDNNKHLHVYIEGDGFGWKTRTRQSNDPTPKNPVSLKLASLDPHPSILYIARPCQYLNKSQLVNCNPKYWSHYRYSADVIESVNEILQWAQSHRSEPQKNIVLIGFSGGGTVAALTAAQRTDVERLLTIAANLDHRYWSRLHGNTLLSHSLNPPDFAHSLKELKQLHLVGSNDINVPRSVVERYLDQIGLPGTVLMEVEGYNHDCCWEELWPEPLCTWASTAC